jgi:hypothetical protein
VGLPNTPSWRGAQLRHRDNFTFNFENKVLRIVAPKNEVNKQFRVLYNEELCYLYKVT